MKSTSLTFAILCLAASISCFKSMGQEIHKLTGVVKDSAGHALEYSQVLLQDKGSQIVQTEMTNNLGAFTIKAKDGDYQLSINYLGKSLYGKGVSLKSDLELGVITVNTSMLLSQVVITGKKKLYERQIDRLTYNVENSIASSGLTLVDALKSAPMVKVDDNTIKLIGKSSVAVMINNRMVNISGEDLVNYLKSFRSDDISKIEIITTPPARYDASGNSGIINIELKRSPYLGWNGNMSGSLTETSYLGYSLGTTLNYQADKVAATVRVRKLNQQSKVLERNSILSESSLVSDNVRKDVNSSYGVSASLNYKINPKSSIDLEYDLSESYGKKYISNVSDYLSKGRIDSSLTTSAIQLNPATTQSLGLYYETKLDTLGKKLSANVSNFSNSPFKSADLSTKSSSVSHPQIIRNTSDMAYSIWSGQTDLVLPLKIVNLETGLKYTKFSNNSNVEYYNRIIEDYSIDSTKSNLFYYNEHVSAAYITGSKEFNKKWSTQIGLRYEYTSVEGYTPLTGVSNKFSYGGLFPSVYLQFKASANYTFNINYARRINRPSFNILNPFRWYSNPYIYTTGNPFLRPSYTNNLEFNYLYKDVLNVSLFGQQTTNGFGGITEYKDGIKVQAPKNYLTQYNVGISSTVEVTPVPWWSSTNAMTVYYSNSISAESTVETVRGLSAYFSSNNTFTINSSKNLFLLVNFSDNLPSRELNVYSRNTYDLSLGLKYSLFNKRLVINSSIQDLFRGSVSSGEIYYKQFKQTFNNYYDNRRFILSATYSFGNRKLKSIGKQINIPEKYRAN